MIENIIYVLIGIVYGLCFILISINTQKELFKLLNKNIKSKTSVYLLRWQSLIIIIFSSLLACIFLLSVLLIKPYIEDWKLFIRMWGIGFLIGVCCVTYLKRTKK